MKTFLITLLSITFLMGTILTGSNPDLNIDLAGIAHELGFEGTIEIFPKGDFTGRYEAASGQIQVTVHTLLWGPLEIRCVLAHEVEHAREYALVEEAGKPDPHAQALLKNLQNLSPYFPTAYAREWWEKGTRWQGVMETLAEMAFVESFAGLEDVPLEWLRAYYALEYWYLEER